LLTTLPTYILVSVTSFGIGLILGWTAAINFDVSESHVRLGVGVLLVIAYVISILAEIRVTGYQTPVLLHGVMGGVIGYIFSRESGFTVEF